MCSLIDKSNRKSQVSFQCLSCGLCMNADFNASKNIEARGLLSTALMFRNEATASA
ncbi:MAG: zinc ribbon domain-containing protein [Janthinobacterium lividum]